MEIFISEDVIRIITVAPKGRLDAFTAPNLRTRVDQLLDEGVHHFILDLSEVDFLDSAGLAVLVSVLKRARQAGGNVRLVRPKQEAGLRILRLTKFDRVFDMMDTPSEALGSFVQ